MSSLFSNKYLQDDTSKSNTGGLVLFRAGFVRFSLVTMVIVMLASTVAGLINSFPVHAAAAGACASGGNYNPISGPPCTPDDEATSYAYYQTLSGCIGGNMPGSFDVAASSGEATTAEMFDSRAAEGYIYPNGAYSTCKDAMTNALQLWGWTSTETFMKAIKYTYLANTDTGRATYTGTGNGADRRVNFQKAVQAQVYGNSAPTLSGAATFLIDSNAFTMNGNACKSTDMGLYSSLSGNDKLFVDAGTDAKTGGGRTIIHTNYLKIPIFNSATQSVQDHGYSYTVTTEANANGTGDAGVATLYGYHAAVTKRSCADLVAGIKKYAPNLKQWALDNRGVKIAIGGEMNKGSNDPVASSCAIEGVGWIICPVVHFLASIADGAYGFLANSFLRTNTALVDVSPDNGTYVAWSYMRTIANVAFVIVFLIIIFSQLTGMGVSNYGVKKLLPRIVIAAILVNISFFISQIAVDLSNILGFSIKDVFNSISAQVDGSGTVNIDSNLLGSATTGKGFAGLAGSVLGIVAVGVAGSAMISTLIPVILAAVVALIMILFILVARQAIIVLLIVISPLAFVAFLLPNTQKMFEQWRKMLTSMLLLFPVIALVFGTSTLASHILTKTNAFGASVSGDTGTLFSQIIASAILVLPLFAVPMILKKSLDSIPVLGQVASKLAGRANGNVGKRLNEQYKNSVVGIGRATKLRARDEFFRRKAAKRISSGGVAGATAGGFSNLGITAKQRAQRDALRNNARATVAGADSEELKQASLALENDLARIAPGDRDAHLEGIATNTSKSDIERSSAMHKLAAGGRDDAIRRLVAHPSLSTPQNQETLRRAIDTNAGSLIGKAPDLVKGASAAFRDVSGTELASFSSGTMKQYMGHMESLRTSTDPADAARYAGAVNGFNAAIEDIKLNSTLQASFKGEAGQAVTAELASKPDLALSIGTQAGFIGTDGKVRP